MEGDYSLISTYQELPERQHQGWYAHAREQSIGTLSEVREGLQWQAVSVVKSKEILGELLGTAELNGVFDFKFY